jgi:hypothetical protein
LGSFADRGEGSHISFVAVAIGGSALLGAASSRRAGNQQANAANQATDVQERADLRAREDLQPFRDLGGGIANTLLDFTKTGPETALERTEGFTQIENSAAAGGKLRSGGTLRGLTEFNSMLNSRNRAQRFNELFNLATLGSNAASRQATNTIGSAMVQGDLITGAGNAKAAGTVGVANAGVNALSNFAFLKQIKPQPVGL